MSWTGSGGSSGNTKKLNAFLMSEDRWHRALKEHNYRISHVKPAVDLKSPWGCSRPYVPLPPQDEHGNHNAAHSHHGSARRSTSRPGSAATTSRPTSARLSRPTSASNNRQQQNNNNANNRPTSATSTSSHQQQYQRPGSATSSYQANPPQTSATASQIISHLPLHQQRLCEEMVKLLAGIDKEHSKVVLEHLYSSAAETRLLQSYSGVYPGLLVSHAADEDDDEGFGDNHNQQQPGSSSQQQQQQQQE